MLVVVERTSGGCCCLKHKEESPSLSSGLLGCFPSVLCNLFLSSTIRRCRCVCGVYIFWIIIIGGERALAIIRTVPTTARWTADGTVYISRSTSSAQCWSPPFLQLLSLSSFPSPAPSSAPTTTTTIAFFRMTASLFKLVTIAALLSSRLANAQSFSLASVNPSAVPLSQIGPSEAASPTPTIPPTPASGSVPTFIPNAPPLPSRKHSNNKY